ncbi:MULTISPECIES: IS110 family transposase [Vibrio]|uniref:IS110 family transposase n=3 Tax=Vibrio TaxID=662 RepID=A0A9X4IRM7_9VIBR|nr:MULTISPECIES: IS110 family transposase [Vibrio]ELH0871177.1 IS110 family transposase [Vibrio cholerae]MBF4253210.1 IS110 family transposase [Vibrio anguillarum]MCG3734705.1 IS110 family transposase [Vibrio cincinnatiensis]MCG3741789.1 IS110 family transposase [Vibrio cincinnatiensis]MDE1244272.1 IS110 family transposase [Vibrio aestuarianus]
MNKYNIIAIDLAKNVFQVCKVSPQGKVLYNREISRAKLKQLLTKEKLSLVSMEACSSAHYWARYAKEAGHQVKVINARSVKGFQTRQKTDRNDALAIATASSLDHIHSIRIQSVDEQAMQSMERARNLALTNQIAQSNQIRGLLLEFGIILPQGLAVLRKEIPYVLEDAENGLPDKFRAALLRLWEHLLIQIDHVDDLTKQLEKAIKANPLCQKLMKLEGVGPIGALGLALRLGKGENFSNGRNASASIGLTPKQHSSGGKERIGHISKRSADKRLRSTLFQGALSVITQVVNRPPRTNKDQWLLALIERRGKKIAAIALANKTVRTAYAILKNDLVYQPEKLA